MVKVLTFRVHQNMIRQLNHFEHVLFFKSRSDMIRWAIIEAVYYTLKGKLKIRSKLTGPTKVIGCRVPENIHRLITGMNSKQRNDTVSVWAAIAVYEWLKRITKQDERNMKSPVYHGLCQDFTHNYRGQVDSLLYELNQLEQAK